MSIKVMTAVWEFSQHKGASLLLLLAIADHAHDNGGGAYPAVSSLAKKIRMSERQVQRILQVLESSEELGIEWGEGPRGTNLYHVRLHRLPPRQDDTPDKMTPPTNPAKRGDKLAGGGDIAASPKPSVNHQQSSKDISTQQQRQETSADRLIRLRSAVKPAGLGRRG